MEARVFALVDTREPVIWQIWSWRKEFGYQKVWHSGEEFCENWGLELVKCFKGVAGSRGSREGAGMRVGFILWLGRNKRGKSRVESELFSEKKRRGVGWIYSGTEVNWACDGSEEGMEALAKRAISEKIVVW